ncbi:MAG TPA: helix-turn-helix transcriptional regulator [Candidatus Aquilonibacter sp.]|nr:helix-turn-helix transcriptional regulator [Candidatus Aquilonibacter sp.]
MARKDIGDVRRRLEIARSSTYRLDLLSKELGISLRQLERYTQEIFKCSPHRWLNERRLTEAGKMLRRQHSVKAVAYGLGFKQVSHFSREFKLYYGVSPKTYLAIAISNRSRLAGIIPPNMEIE